MTLESAIEDVFSAKIPWEHPSTTSDFRVGRGSKMTQKLDVIDKKLSDVICIVTSKLVIYGLPHLQ